MRVAVELEELRRVGLAEDELPGSVPQRHHGRDRALGRILHRHRSPPPGAAGEGNQALPVGPGRDLSQRNAREFGQRRQHVERRDGGGDPPRGDPRRRERQRHARGALAEAHLEPQPALAQHVAVVRQEHHGGVLTEAAALQHLEDLPDPLVDVGDLAEISPPGAAHVLAADVEPLVVAHPHEPPGMGIVRLEGHRRRLGLQRRAVGVEVPMSRPRDVGVVRVGEAHRQAPGPRIEPARQLVELGHRVVGHLVVVLELVGDLGRAGGGHGAEVVIPPVDALVGARPVRGSSRSRRGRCRLSTAPRSRGAGRGRRNASCPTGRSGSPRGAGGGRRSGWRRRTRRRCRRRACGSAAGPT